MDSVGIAFADVTHALLSHSHIDHIGGLASGGNILFPNAAVHVLREELVVEFLPARCDLACHVVAFVLLCFSEIHDSNDEVVLSTAPFRQTLPPRS